MTWKRNSQGEDDVVRPGAPALEGTGPVAVIRGEEAVTVTACCDCSVVAVMLVTAL
jgi:hypothetical protein